MEGFLMKNDYTQFDATLQLKIMAGINTAHRLEPAMQDLAEPFCYGSSGSWSTPAYRIVDRRLQALRKAGKIAFDGKVWSVKRGGEA
jgi:hypothetical protein